MNLVPTLRVLLATGMNEDEAYDMIGRGEDTLMRYLRFRFASIEQMIHAFECAEQGRPVKAL